MDGLNAFKAGGTVELQPIRGEPLGPAGNGRLTVNFQLAPDRFVGATVTPAQLHDIQAMYPNGISRHGAYYLFRFPSQDGNPNQNWFFEFVAEVIRAADFPHRPSRLTSMSLCETIEGARTFAEARRQPPWSIVRVEYETGFRADMNLLTGFSMVELMSNARLYWKGEPGPSPPFWEVIAALPARVLDVVESTPVPPTP